MALESKFHTVAEGFSGIKARTYNPEVFPVSGETKAYLDKFVAEQTERANAKGGRFYDGDLIGIVMDSLEAENGILTYKAQRMKYSQHAALFRGKADAPIQALYVNGIVITADNKIVMGSTQATEADFMGKLGIPAGGVNLCPDGHPSLGYQLFVELSEEIGFAPDYHLDRKRQIIPCWVNGASSREGNYHLTTTFVVPLVLNEAEMHQWFSDWKFAQEKWMKPRGMKTEFKELRFLPNDAAYIREFVQEQDAKGKAGNLLGKSLDVIDKWALSYNCDVSKLQAAQGNVRINLPQPSF